MTTSLWTATAAATRFPSLNQDIDVDVAIVGGGITGLLCAALLARNGASVAVLEAARLGEGTTGYSTGNLYAPVDWHLYVIADKWDSETTIRSRNRTTFKISGGLVPIGASAGERLVSWLIEREGFLT